MVRKNYKTEDMLIDDLHEGVRELGELTHDTKTRLGDKAVSAIRRLEKAIPSVKERFSDWKENWKDHLGDHARSAGEQLDKMAKDKPWQLAGWAAGIGFVLGVLLLGGGDSRKD